MRNENLYHEIAKCESCGQPIRWTGVYWDHMGENKPRHIATPVDDSAVSSKPRREYYRNHRTIGYKIGVTIIDGSEYTLLQTETLDPIACLTTGLLPVDMPERRFDARLAIADAIDRARFLGIEDADIEELFKAELHHESK